MIRRVCLYLGKGLKKLGTLFECLGQDLRLHNNVVRKASATHDMARHPDEFYYAQQYLYWIKFVLGDRLTSKDGSALDLGCGQGRLTIPVSEFCGRVTGVDFTLQAVNSAKKYALQAGCKNVNFVLSDISEYIKAQSEEFYDLIVFNEVIFFLPDYKNVLNEIYRTLKSGGIACISFRSQLFDVLYSIREKKWDSADMAIAQREGYLWGGSTWFSWHTKEEIEKLLREAGFGLIDCVGIGVCSGIEGDPLAGIARPSLLDAEGQKRMMDIEIQLAKQYTNQGRYILAMAKK